MHEISEGNTLEMHNVISYRSKITQQQMTQVINEINDIISENKAVKTGIPVSATFSVDINSTQPLMDVEILVPLDKKISVPYGYTFKPVFRLKNAVRVRHTGNPSLLQESADELMKYIAENQLMPVTSGYNVTVHEPEGNNDKDNFIMDIYVGVCDNIL